MNKIKILDACCGGRMFWFNKQHPLTTYVDVRTIEEEIIGSGKNARKWSCKPDIEMDFRKLSFSDESFNLVVFDPPHLVSAGNTGYMGRKYGSLSAKTWRDDLSLGFSECFRVLKTGGTLIFKWNECDIPLKDVLALTERKPLFGHPSGKKQKTHWVTFIKSFDYE